MKTQAIVFLLRNGEREALITNVEEGEIEAAAFPELYDKRWSVETKYKRVKQQLEFENFSGWLVDNIKQDFYGMMMVSNLLSSVLREANEKIPKGKTESRQDRLIGILITDDRLTRKYLILGISI